MEGYGWCKLVPLGLWQWSDKFSLCLPQDGHSSQRMRSAPVSLNFHGGSKLLLEILKYAARS